MNKVINDSLISTLFQFLKIFARFFIGIYIVKQLEVQEYGAYNLFLVIISFGSVILSFNTHEYFNIEISSSKNLTYKHRIFWSIMEILLLFSIIFYLILSNASVSHYLSVLLGIEAFGDAYSYVLLLLILTTISMTIGRYLAYSRYVLFFQSWTFAVQTAWVVPLFFVGLNVKNIFYSQLIILLPLTFLGLYYIYKHEKEHPLFAWKNIKPDIHFMSSAFKFGVGTYFALIGSFLLDITDKSMLSMLYSNEAVAYYSFSNIPFSILKGFIIGTVFLIAMPYINQFNSSDPEKKFHLYSDLLKSFVLYLSGLVLSIVLLSEEIILFLGKEEYLQTYIVFPLLSVNFLLTVMMLLFKHELMLQKSLKLLSMIYFSALIINIILNFMLIENYSYKGAIFSTLTANLFIVSMLYFKTDIKKHLVVKPLKALLFAGVLLVIVLLYSFIGPLLKSWMASNALYLMIMLIVLYLPYLMLLSKLKLIPQAHLETAKKVFLTKVLKRKK